MFSNFDFDVIIRSLPYLFLDGMTFTLMLTALATAIGIVVGTLLALMRLSAFAPVSILAAGYVNLMRSVPLVLMIFWFYFLVPYIGQWITGAAQPISCSEKTPTQRQRFSGRPWSNSPRPARNCSAVRQPAGCSGVMLSTID